MKILLIANKPEDIRQTREAFIHNDFSSTLHVSESNRDALRYLAKEGAYAFAPTPDMILLDYHLLKESGDVIFETLKTDPNLHSIPVIVLTSSNDHDCLAKIHSTEASYHLPKPISLEKLLMW